MVLALRQSDQMTTIASLVQKSNNIPASKCNNNKNPTISEAEAIANAIAEVNAVTSKIIYSDSNTVIPKKFPAFRQWEKKNRSPESVANGVEYPSYEQVISLNIKINTVNNQKRLMIDNRRLFVAIFTAFKLADPSIYVEDISNTENDLTDVDLTPTDEEALEKFMQHPTISRKGIFTCRIHFRGDTPLFVIKKNQNLMQWLRSENIMIELNNLDFRNDIKLANVGFFVNCHPRESIMTEQTERLKKL